AFTGKERVHETDCVQGIPMTASAIRDVHAVLSGALQPGCRVGLANRQPGPRRRPFLMLAVMVGSRRGEQCSLRWTDVDFDHGEVLSDSGVIATPGRPLIDHDRTKNYPKRRVAVGPATLELLRPPGRGARRYAAGGPRRALAARPRDRSIGEARQP